jgi:uncharacterized membrane-anchored protein YjiN (DUF445 family)
MNYRKKANLTLGAVFCVFLLALWLQRLYPISFGIRLLYFVAEAALVGGLADWFAVTAIFKKPLGWGYHTELIPKNRERLIEAVAAIVQTELLKMDLIRTKLEKISFLDGIINFINKKGGAAYLTDSAVAFACRYAESKGLDSLSNKVAMFLQKAAKNWDLAPRIQEIGSWALKGGYIDQGLDRLAEGLWDKAAEEPTRELIASYLEGIKEEKVSSGGSIFRTLIGFVEKSDGLNINEAADALQVELLLTLRKLRDPQDPLRRELKDAVVNEINKAGLSHQFVEQIERWKEDLLAEAFVQDFIESLLKIIRDGLISLQSEDDRNTDTLYQGVYACIEKSWLNLQKNIFLRDKLNSLIVDTLFQLIQNEHHLIGNMVRETLSAYTDQDLNEFVEEKAGNDLQWIRINGSMIGGVVGLFVFLFLNFVYDPLIPVLQSFLLHH